MTEDPRHPVSLSLYKADPRGCTFQEPMGRFPCTARGPTRLDSKLLQGQSHVFAQKSIHGQRLWPRPTVQMVHRVPHELPLTPTATTFPSRSLIRHTGHLLASEQVRLPLALGSFRCSCLSQARSSFPPFFPIFAPRSPSQAGLPPSLFCTPTGLTCSVFILILITVCSYTSGVSVVYCLL